jgi:UDP-N-acetylglucosamine transferase subunit ALG13/CelD/BcsL family acetyltransferase involved in cellulose biosynthesis
VIFVTLGTHGQPFGRLIRALDALPSAELVVQHGHSPAPAGALRAVPFMPFSEVLEHIDAADTVITHAGVGSILCATRAGHTPIVVPRLELHGEHVDDHQVELTGALADRGMVVPAWELDRLAETVSTVPSRRARAVQSERPIHSAVGAAIRPPSSSNGRVLGEEAHRLGSASSRAHRGARNDATALQLERMEGLEPLRADWERLAELSGDVFRTWEWADTWWRHFGRDRRLLLFACRDATGRVEAILPLYEPRRRPLRLVRFLGHGAGDRLGPVCAPESIPAAADALRRALWQAPEPWDLFLGERLPSEEGWAPLLGGPPIRHEPSPVLATDGQTWDEYMSSRSANFRSQLRRRERRLAQAHEVRYRLVEEPASLEREMDTLCRLHAARWDGESSGALSGRREAFHREFAARALERGWLRLWILDVDGRTVAAWYGYRFGEVEWYYQAGRDPAWDDASVGSVLFVHTIREAFNDGMREYRMLRGGEAYKERFASADPGLDTVAWWRGALGRPALAALRRAADLSPGARRRLSRLAG